MSDFVNYQEEPMVYLLQEGYIQQGDDLAEVGFLAIPQMETDLVYDGLGAQSNSVEFTGIVSLVRTAQAAPLTFPLCDGTVDCESTSLASSISVPAQFAFGAFTSNFDCFDSLEQAIATPTTNSCYLRRQYVGQAVEPGSARPLVFEQAELDPNPFASLPSCYSYHENPTDSKAQFVLTDNNSQSMTSTVIPESQLEAPQMLDENPSDQNNYGAMRKLGERFACDHPGCNRKEPFKRAFELERHKGTHSKNKLDCPVEGCSRKGSNGIRRDDKLKEHVRRCHSVKDKLPCPVQSCSVENMTMDLLREHGTRHGWSFPCFGWPGLCSRSYRICPLEGCRKCVKNPSKLQQHLTDHEVRDRMAQRTAVIYAGYHPETVQIICPSCKDGFQDHQSFEKHFYDSHITIDVSHAQKWFDNCRSRGFLVNDSPDGVFFDTTIEVPRNATVNCPMCDFTFRGNLWNPSQLGVKGHGNLFTWSDELHSIREAVLRLLPGFGCHSVFNDLDPRR